MKRLFFSQNKFKYMFSCSAVLLCDIHAHEDISILLWELSVFNFARLSGWNLILLPLNKI